MTSICRRCGGAIGWGRYPSGAFGPTEPDGGDHYDVCSKRITARANAEGTAFTDQVGTGVVWNSKKRYNRMDGKAVTGSAFVEPQCANPCGLPPWEVCACSRWPGLA